MSATTANGLLNEVARHGGRLVLLGGDRLRAEAPEPLPDDLMARLRERKAEVLRLLREQQEAAEKTDARRVLFTNYGAGYVHPDGRVETGEPDPMPRAVLAWPTDLNDMLRRVSTFYEWSNGDVTDFRRWARRDQQGVDDARQFLEHEASKLPQPGSSDRRRIVLGMLQADPTARYAWTCLDRDSGPVVLVVAIRDVGTCELSVPRERFDALALPQLIDSLTKEGAP